MVETKSLERLTNATNEQEHSNPKRERQQELNEWRSNAQAGCEKLPLVSNDKLPVA